jgi:hemerythrin-like metal-binding protein
MSLFIWNDSKFSVGVKELDNQHKKLVDTLNQLYDGMMSGQAKNVTGTLLTKLVSYTGDHFATEERLFANTRYPQADSHKKEHLKLTRQVEDFVGRFNRGEVALNVPLLNFLRDWLSKHIVIEDKKYGSWLNKAGVK